MSDERFDPKEQPAELPPRKWPDHRERLPPPVIPSRELAEKVDEFIAQLEFESDPSAAQRKANELRRQRLIGGPEQSPAKPETEDDAENWNRGEQ